MKILVVLSAVLAVGYCVGGSSKGSSQSFPAPHSGYGFPPHFPGGRAPLTTLDKIYEQIADIRSQMKFFHELLDAVGAQLSVQNKKVHELKSIVTVALEEIDMSQSSGILKLERHLKQADDDCEFLKKHIQNLLKLNEKNSDLARAADEALAYQVQVDIQQDADLYYLHKLVTWLKPKLFQVKENNFQLFLNRVERDATVLKVIKARENRRMCESGQVTLTSGSPRIEYSYQNWFDKPPQVIFGFAGKQVNVDALQSIKSYGYPPKEPEAIGAILHSYSTKSTLTIQGFDFSFGDSDVTAVDVSFLACTITPGLGPALH